MLDTVFQVTELVRHPSAILDAEGAVALLLPIHALADTQEHEGVVRVRVENGIMYWHGDEGRIHAVSQWHQSPHALDPRIETEVNSDEGLLVCFLHAERALDSRWMLFRHG